MIATAATAGGAYLYLNNSENNSPDGATDSDIPGMSQHYFPGVYQSSSKLPGVLDLDWGPLRGDDPEFVDASYQLQYSHRKHFDFDFDDLGVESLNLTKNQQARIEGLTPNTNVYFKLRANLVNGTSLVPPLIHFNSSKTIAFEPKFKANITHKNLNELGYKDISIDLAEQAILVESSSALEPILAGYFLTGTANNGAPVFALAQSVEDQGAYLKISYVELALEQVFAEYHAVANNVLTAPNDLFDERRQLQSAKQIGGDFQLPIAIPLNIEPEESAGSVKTVLSSVITLEMETFIEGASIQNASFVIDGKHHFQVDFGLTVAETGTEIEWDRDVFKEKFKNINRLLKAAALARATGGPFGLLLPKFGIEAEFTFNAKAALTAEARMSRFIHHTNKITYSKANGWEYTNKSHPEVFTSEEPKIEIKGEASSSLRLIPEVSFGLWGGADLLELEVGPYIEASAAAEATDFPILHLVGPVSVRDLSLSTGINVNAETDLTKWFGFGDSAVLYDEDYFVTEHVSFPEIPMEIQCQNSQVPNVVKAKVIATLKDGTRLPISKDAAVWFRGPMASVQGQAYGNSYDVSINNNGVIYPVDVYRISELEDFPAIRVSNKTSINRGTCDAGAVEEEDFTIDEEEVEKNGKCVPAYHNSNQYYCCSSAEEGAYSEAPMALINENINAIGVDFLSDFNSVTGSCFFDSEQGVCFGGYQQGFTPMQQVELAVGEAISLIGDSELIEAAGFGDSYDAWAAIWLDLRNDIINMQDPRLRKLGDVDAYNNAVGLSTFTRQCESTIPSNNIDKINQGLVTAGEAKSYLVTLKSSIASAQGIPSASRQSSAEGMQAAIDLCQRVIDALYTWDGYMNAIISECNKVKLHVEAGLEWLANDAEHCNKCNCENVDRFVSDPNSGARVKDPSCLDNYCN